VRTDLLDAAVWREVERLLEDPARLAAEYERRLVQACDPKIGQEGAIALEAQIAKLRRSVGRLIDSYAEGILEKAEFEPRLLGLRGRLARLEEQRRALLQAMEQRATLSLIIGRLEDFAATVQDRLLELDWTGKRELIRTLVKRVEIGPEDINVVFRVALVPTMPQPAGSGVDPEPGSRSLQDCWGREEAGPRRAPDRARGQGPRRPRSRGGARLLRRGAQRHYRRWPAALGRFGAAAKGG
jgi:site-specific DNA recombinase